ncbi:MAG: hypothetical protein FWG70_06740 [Oscillospiraceae bacterium]|nr:hypothetical protein [Oscillospiraceae bacterium]
MKSTKILALIITLAMSLTLAACGNEATPSSNTPNNDPPANNQGTNAENLDNNTPDNGTETPSAPDTSVPSPNNGGNTPLYLPESFKTHESDADFFLPMTDNYVAYSYEIILRDSGEAPWVQTPDGDFVRPEKRPDEITTGVVVYFFDDNDFGLTEFDAERPAVFIKKAFPDDDEAADYYSRFKSDKSDRDFSLVGNIIYARGLAGMDLDIVAQKLLWHGWDVYNNTTKAEFLEKLTESLDELQDRYKPIDEYTQESNFKYDIYVSQP